MCREPNPLNHLGRDVRHVLVGQRDKEPSTELPEWPMRRRRAAAPADGGPTGITGRPAVAGVKHWQDRRPMQDGTITQTTGRPGPYGEQLPGQGPRLKPGAGTGIILTSGPHRGGCCGAETGRQRLFPAIRRTLPHPAPCSRMVFLQTCLRARGRRALPHLPL